MNKDIVRNVILAVALVIVAFLWIWLYNYTGAKAFWVALISFGVYLAAGADGKKLPWMTLGAVLGVILGVATYYLSMLVLPFRVGTSVAIAGAVFLLVGAIIALLFSLIRSGIFLEIFPMLIVGWGGMLGALYRFDYLFNELVVESMPRVITTFIGVMASVLFGLLFGALLGTVILKVGRKEETVEEAPLAESVEGGVG